MSPGPKIILHSELKTGCLWDMSDSAAVLELGQGEGATSRMLGQSSYSLPVAYVPGFYFPRTARPCENQGRNM